MSKTFKRNSRYNNWNKDKHNKSNNQRKFDYESPKTNYAPQVKEYSPFDDSMEYHQSFAR